MAGAIINTALWFATLFAGFSLIGAGIPVLGGMLIGAAGVWLIFDCLDI